jgi:hypothetical protein
MFLLDSPSFPFFCPVCNSVAAVEDTLWQGTHLLADCICKTCRFEFYHTYPTGHGLHFPLAFAKNQPQTFPSPHAGSWFYQPLFDAYYQQKSNTVPVEKKVRRNFDKVIILNCLDYLYGHVLLRLLNAQAHLEATPEIGLIVILPKSMAWLLPDGIAEAWLLDIGFVQLKDRVENLDAFVKNELVRFEKVYISYTFTHPDWNKIDIARFAKVKPFDLEHFSEKPQPITFIWREDRFWLGVVDEFLWKAAFKLKVLRHAKFYFIFRQRQKFLRTAQLIQKKMPEVQFFIAGLGKTGQFPAWLHDRRSENPDAETETAWCELYTKSHLVIGIHGSNMILPTALAAGFIELLPRYRLDNFADDIASAFHDRRHFFLSRVLDMFSSPKLVALHACQILGGFTFLNLNFSEKYKTYQPDSGLSEVYRKFYD